MDLQGENLFEMYCIYDLMQVLLLLQHLILLMAAPATQPGATIEDYENYYNEIDVEDSEADVKTRNALNSPLQRWPSHTIPYKISSNYNSTEEENVHTALQVFNERTCLKFRPFDPKLDGQRRYVNYKKSPDMCGTRVGFNPLTPIGPHDVVLSPSCLRERGIIQHETLHVLGLFHEQSRPDRDNFIQVDYSNIPQKYWSQFVVYPKIYTTTFDVDYDYESLMHYSQFAFATDPTKPSMRAKAGAEVFERKMGQIKEPSEGDLTKIRIMYKCL